MMFSEMDPWIVSTIYLIALVLFVLGIVFINYGSNRNKKDKHLLPLIIVGWVLVIATIVGSIALLILFIGADQGITGTMFFLLLSPVVIFAGLVACFATALNSLQSAYRKPKDDVTRKQSIVKGWALLALAILIIVALVVSLSILLTNYSNYRNEHPVRFM